MKLTDVITKNLVMVDTDYTSKEACIDVLCERLYQEGKINSIETYKEAVREREELCSTYCTMEIAIPHGITDAVLSSTLCFLKNKTCFDWDGDGETPVRYIFLIAVSGDNHTGENNEHMAILSKIATLTIEDDFRDALAELKSADEFIELLNGIEKEN